MAVCSDIVVVNVYGLGHICRGVGFITLGMLRRRVHGVETLNSTNEALSLVMESNPGCYYPMDYSYVV